MYQPAYIHTYTHTDTLADRMHATSVQMALTKVRSDDRAPQWVDLHSTALQSTLDVHREGLVKLVRIQSTMARNASVATGGARHSKLAALGLGKNSSATRRNKKMLAMMMDEGGDRCVLSYCGIY